MLTRVQIVQRSDFDDYVHIPASFAYNSRMVPHVLRAQNIDLQELLGRDFYRQLAAVLNDAGSTTVGAITTPSTTAPTANTVINFDLDAFNNMLPYLTPIIVLRAMFYYVKYGYAHHTRYGTRIKLNPHSEEITEEQREEIAQNYKSQAVPFIDDFCNYLSNNESSYPDFDGDTFTNSPKSTGIKIIGV